MKKLFIVSGLLGLLALTGCAPDKHIAEVKALPFSYPSENVQDPNMTVDQALDYRNVCDSVKWKIDETEQHQTFVQYDCTYKGVKDSMFIARDITNSPSNNPAVAVGETYQWIFGSDGKPSLTYIALHYRYANGNSKDVSRLNLGGGAYIDGAPWYTAVMQMAVENKVADYDHVLSHLYGWRIPVKPAKPFTDTTYGNTLTAYYPGHNAAQAASLAYQWKRAPIEGVFSIGVAGYPIVSINDRFVDQLFPVNPADVQFAKKIDTSYTDTAVDNLSSNNPYEIIRLLQLAPNKLFCLSNRCYDRNAQTVGRAPESVLAQEVGFNKWAQISGAASASKSEKETANTPDALAVAMASTAMTPPTPAPQVAQAVQPTPVAPVTQQVVNSATATLTGASQSHGQPVADAAVHSGDVGPDGWPKMTPCIQKLQDKFTADQQKQNADTSTSLEQMQEWASVCKSLGQ
ncbi:hypothetical protein [Rhodanobacter geophilus]|uniref:Lipoprotein n=1 Tax=Rhodanobacter geophilus TaxID=3162488 RepID=A0ABV3QKT8_9GAMM